MPGSSFTRRDEAPSATPWGFLPPRLKVLFIASRQRTGDWLAEALAFDNACEVLLDEVAGAAAGLARLRDEVYDAVLISHEPPELDALDLLDVLRTGSQEQQPLLVLGHDAAADMAALCLEAGASAYVCVQTTAVRTLIWQVARAVQQHHVLKENRRLESAQRSQLQREQQEARKLLREQQTLCDRLGAAAPRALPARLVDHYRDLMRAHIIMGTGNLTAELKALAEVLAQADCRPCDAMQLHVSALEEAIQGLGSRSARHVMNRADLMGMELLMHLASCFHATMVDLIRPPRQLSLPGFDDAAHTVASGAE
ncbi:MAG: hypothetical protein KDA41_15330 [Planctomycetales bacterium]|nr:hypothetical protein [Planctomycetales bacterium]